MLIVFSRVVVTIIGVSVEGRLFREIFGSWVFFVGGVRLLVSEKDWFWSSGFSGVVVAVDF